MSTRLRIASLLLLIAVLVQAYLSWHYYPVKFGGQMGQMSCNINETFNCDATTASSYSEIAGIPISILGGMALLMVLFFTMISAYGWTDFPERTHRYGLYLISFLTLASLVMGAISVMFIKSYCLFCISVYVLTILAFVLMYQETPAPRWSHLKDDILALFKASQGSLILFLAVPVSSFLMHQAFLSHYGVKDMQAMVDSSLVGWKNNPEVKFDASAAMVKGPDRANASAILVEFADFRCHHCKDAYPIVKSFHNNNKNVRIEFFNFPLDGSCNPALKARGGDGISCRLAKSVFCMGQKDMDKAWTLHDHLFDSQEKTVQMQTVEDVDQLVQAWTQPNGASWDDLKSCMDKPDTQQKIERQAKIGEIAQVEGTPSIYLQGRKLPGGQFLLILEEALKSLKK